MRKIIYISPEGVTTPQLFDTFKETFAGNGIGEAKNFNEADIAFIDLYSDVRPIDGIISDILDINNTPIVFFQEKDFGGMSKEVFNESDYKWHNGEIVLFVRKMDKTIQYPSWVYPYELIQYPDHDFALVSKEELFNRPNDICFIGNISPQRISVCDSFIQHFICDFVLGEERLPHNQWLDRHRKSKLFLTADGGGFSDERPYQLMTISAMLRQKNNHFQPYPFSDCVNCLEVSEQPTADEISGIKAVLNDPDYLYEIYLDGVEHLKKYYSEEARANYILDVLKQNNIL